MCSRQAKQSQKNFINVSLCLELVLAELLEDLCSLIKTAKTTTEASLPSVADRLEVRSELGRCVLGTDAGLKCAVSGRG